MSMDLPLLWHIPLSHFNEKVRWALDFKNIPHRRECVGADYLFKAWRATGHGTLPILFLNGQPIRDSTAIIAELEQRYGEPALYPKDETQRRHALELEDYFDEMLGPSVRAAIILPLFQENPDLALRVLTTGMPDAAYRNLRRLRRVFPAFYRFRHKIKAQRLQQDRADVANALDRISHELKPSGYLVGETFSVADLTAAALLGALLQPPELPPSGYAARQPAAVLGGPGAAPGCTMDPRNVPPPSRQLGRSPARQDYRVGKVGLNILQDTEPDRWSSATS